MAATEGPAAVAADGAARRDRAATWIGLLAVAGLAWAYLWVDAARMAGMDMAGMDGMNMGQGMGQGMSMGPGMAMTSPSPSPWRPEALAATFVMWAIMMVGMMLPSALPAISLYGTMVRKHRERGSALPSVWLFAAGYLAVWTGFSLLAALLQAGLEQAMLLSPMMVSTSPWLSGGLLVLAGVYQWLPVKEACLAKCRAPLQFFLTRWRAGPAGAVRMGAEHGAFCVGCCWALMLLLFTAGVMNLLWVAVIAGFVLVEKVLGAQPWAGRWIARAAGVALVVAGVAVMAA